MDAGAFVQENKRWLVGCAVGALVWLIGSTVVDSMYQASLVSARSLGALSDVYTQQALGDAKAEQEALQVERDRLVAELGFEPSARYTQWSGPADSYLYTVGRELQERVDHASALRGVQIDTGALRWEKYTGLDEIRQVLVGLDLMDEVQQRLFAAHDATRDLDEDARGLVAIQSLRLEPKRNSRGMRRPTGGRRDEVDLSELMTQETLEMQFQADESTLALFLESCRKPGRAIVLDKWSVTKPSRPGEVCTVKATVSAITFRKVAEEQ